MGWWGMVVRGTWCQTMQGLVGHRKPMGFWKSSLEDFKHRSDEIGCHCTMIPGSGEQALRAGVK